MRFLAMKSSWLEAPSAYATSDGASSVQELRHPNDVAGEEKQSLVNIKGFAGGREFRLLHMNANEMLNAALGIEL